MAYSAAVADRQSPLPTDAAGSWEARAAERSPQVQQSRARSIRHARVIVDAARRLMVRKGEFTTQELVKEAGVALQTFYRYFASKDELLVAVLADEIGEHTRTIEARAAEIDDPVDRLRVYVTWPLSMLHQPDRLAGEFAITTEHWRLHRLFPDEMARVDRPLVDLVRRTLLEAEAAGQLTPQDAARDAWLIVDMMRSVYHHYACAPLDRPIDEIAEHVWSFCFRAVGGTFTKGSNNE